MRKIDIKVLGSYLLHFVVFTLCLGLCAYIWYVILKVIFG